MSGTALDTIKSHFPALVEKWRPIVARGGGTEWAVLSKSERKVFEIKRKRYARMCAMHETWEAIIGRCDMGSYDPDLLVAAKEEATWLHGKYDGGITGYLKLCSLLGVRHRDGYAMFYKVIFSERRYGLHSYNDETYSGG